MDASERDLMIRTMLSEGGANASPEEHAAIAHVILNRAKLGSQSGYADDIKGVVKQPYAFEPWNNPAGSNSPLRWKKGSKAYEAAGKIVDGAVSGEIEDPTGGYTHFLEPGEVSKRVKSGKLKQWPSWAHEGGVRVGRQVFYPHDPNAPSTVPEAAYGTDDDPLLQAVKPKQPDRVQSAAAAGGGGPVTGSEVYGTDDDPLMKEAGNRRSAAVEASARSLTPSQDQLEATRKSEDLSRTKGGGKDADAGRALEEVVLPGATGGAAAGLTALLGLNAPSALSAARPLLSVGKLGAGAAKLYGVHKLLQMMEGGGMEHKLGTLLELIKGGH